MAQLQSKTPTKKLTAEALKANPFLLAIARQRAKEIREISTKE